MADIFLCGIEVNEMLSSGENWRIIEYLRKQMIEMRALRKSGACLEMQVRNVDLTEGSEILIREELIG